MKLKIRQAKAPASSWAVEIAGGEDVFREKARSAGAQKRIVNVDAVAAASPDLIIGSWCGKKFVPGRVTSRPGLEKVAAVQNKAVREIKSSLILQPGPAALTEGLSESELSSSFQTRPCRAAAVQKEALCKHPGRTAMQHRTR